ncbi:MAG: flagellar basal-body rod protein FlgG [Paracoccaceae bacterium]|jgi:flagellar basal-body rod protein FlgG
MLLRVSLPIVLAALVACQSTSSAPGPDAAWRAGVERSQVELRIETEIVRSLLAARGLTSGGSGPLAASLTGLGDRIAQLEARLMAGGGAQVTNASYSVPGDDSSGGLESLKQALLVLEQEHAVHCENIANAGTPGYKRRALTRSTDVYGEGGAQVPSVQGSRRNMLQGVLELTGNQLDFAIEGQGFFEVMLPNGSFLYQREGRFRQDLSGRLVTEEGYLLTDYVSIPPNGEGLSVSPDGQVFAISQENGVKQIGAIRLSTFVNGDGLKAKGGNYYVPTPSSGNAQRSMPGVHGTGKIKQGYIERSNVNLTDELISLQLVERRAAAVRQALATLGVYVP